MKYIHLRIEMSERVEFKQNYKFSGFDLTPVTEDVVNQLETDATNERLVTIQVNGETYRSKIDPDRVISCTLQGEIFVLDVERDLREKSRGGRGIY